MHVQKFARQSAPGIGKSPETLVAGGTQINMQSEIFRSSSWRLQTQSLWNGSGSGLPTLTTFVTTRRRHTGWTATLKMTFMKHGNKDASEGDSKILKILRKNTDTNMLLTPRPKPLSITAFIPLPFVLWMDGSIPPQSHCSSISTNSIRLTR